MAKEFKDYDQKYKRFAGTALLQIEAVGGKVNKDDIAACDHWTHTDRFTEEYSMQTIRYAVYEAPGAEEWQKFRVSLKGLTTREKLYCLNWYYDMHVSVGPGAHLTLEDWSRHILRINNYLGALKRGGQLDSVLRVAKG